MDRRVRAFFRWSACCWTAGLLAYISSAYTITWTWMDIHTCPWPPSTLQPVATLSCCALLGGVGRWEAEPVGMWECGEDVWIEPLLHTRCTVDRRNSKKKKKKGAGTIDLQTCIAVSSCSEMRVASCYTHTHTHTHAVHSLQDTSISSRGHRARLVQVQPKENVKSAAMGGRSTCSHRLSDALGVSCSVSVCWTFFSITNSSHGELRRYPLSPALS